MDGKDSQTSSTAAILRGSAFLLATEGSGAALGVLFWFLVASRFADEEVGTGAALISGTTLLALLSTLGLNMSLVRFLASRDADASRIIGSSLAVSTAAASVLAIVFALGAWLWSPILAFLGSDLVLLGLFAAFTVLWTAHLLFDAVFVGLGHAEYNLARGLLFNGIKVPAPFALVLLLPAAFALFAGWGIGLLVADVATLTLFLRRARPGLRIRLRPDRTQLASMARFSAANHVTNVLGALPGLGFPLLAAHLLGPAEAGYFYLAWILANLLFLVPGSIFTIVLAEGSRAQGDLPRLARRGFLLSSGLLGLGLAGVLLLGPWILGTLKPTYLAAAAALDILAVSAIFVEVNVLFVTLERIRGRMGRVIALYAGTTAASLALAVPLMASMGLAGVGWAFAAGQGAGAVAAGADLLLRPSGRIAA